MDNYLIKNKNKLNISIDSLNFIGDDHKHFKVVSNKLDNNINDVEEHSKIIHLKEQNINDPYNLPDTVSKFKILDINESDFNNLVMGYDDPSLRFRGTKRIQNAYLYGEPSEKEIMVSNWQTEEGISNDLNQKILQAQTGESFEDIKGAQSSVDSEYDKGLNDILEQLNKDKEIIKEKINKNDPLETRTIEEVEKEYDDLKEEKKELNKKGKIKEKANIKPVIERIKKIDTLTKKNTAKKIQNYVRNKQSKAIPNVTIPNVTPNVTPEPNKISHKVFDELFDDIDKDLLEGDTIDTETKQNEIINHINEAIESATINYKKLNELFKPSEFIRL